MDRSGADPVYGIGAVARMLGLTAAALRAWEERYGVVIPSRSPGDQRLYSRDQVDQLRYARNLMESGLHAAEAHRLLARRIEDGMTLVPATPSETPAPVSILLAERDVYAAELVEYLLRTEGYEVVVALDGPDAVAVYEQRRPDLVVVELVISGGSGLELCRTLGAAGARVVAVSALELGAAAVDAGAEAFLRKPLDPLQVLSTVKDLVGASPMTRLSPFSTRR
jgi:CheY-like chemotaxis protein